MAFVSALAVGLGGAAGAVSRYAVAMAIERRAIDVFAVNVTGSFALGFVLGVGLEGPAHLALAVGFCGAFTTFSAFAVETVALVDDGQPGTAAVHAVGTLIAAVLAVLAGGAVAALI